MKFNQSRSDLIQDSINQGIDDNLWPGLKDGWTGFKSAFKDLIQDDNLKDISMGELKMYLFVLGYELKTLRTNSASMLCFQ